MSLKSLLDTELFNFIILPLAIFLARIVDVSLGTLRIVFVSKGLKYLAPLIGFIEVIIWLLAIRVIMQNLNNAVCYLAYGAGFAMGTFIGLLIENRMAIGSSLIRIITQKDASGLINDLQSKGHGVTSIDANGVNGKVNVIYSIIRRQNYRDVIEAIKRFNPKAFYTVEDVKLVREGIFPIKKYHVSRLPLIGPFRFWRKGK